MKTKPSHSAGLAAVTYALVLLSGDVYAKGGRAKDSCIPYRIGDGHCDQSQNTKACGYDGGDCCECTCTSGPNYSCKSSKFACVDPGASCIDVTSGQLFESPLESTSSGSSNISPPCVPEFFADGDCDDFNNNEECGYDQGDCCECTCVSTTSYTCGDEVHGGFECLDPGAPCVDDTDDASSFGSPQSMCNPSFFADGDCDLVNNNEACGFDGGDCCECTCVTASQFVCGDPSGGGFACIDPGAPCVDDDDITTNPSTESTTYFGSTTTAFDCVPDYFSDGLCDSINNNEDCEYDGGDCCACTCVDTPDFACGATGPFACLDPSAPCVDDDDVTTFPDDTSTNPGYTSSFGCETAFFSDGDCDESNNRKECGFDGGDCCECTCVSTPSFTCGDGSHGDFDCIDPDAPCVDEDDDMDSLPANDDVSTSSGSTTSLSCIPDYFSDGICDFINNDEVCGFDGGDCCECTCVDTMDFTCGDESFGTFDCVDPSAPCVDEDDVTIPLPENDDDSTCVVEYISDGLCDGVNNDAICGFDGGDCCECTCVSTEEFSCGDGAFECVDPRAPCFQPDNDDDIISLESDTEGPTSSCIGEDVSNGVCDPGNNNEECGYDGGDCCECTCVSTSEIACGDSEGFDCIDPDSSCEENLVEAGTKTTIGVSTNTFDTRVGEALGGVGCGQDGCGPELTRDGSVDLESRWACAQKLNPGGGLCEIGFVFEDPQDIFEVEVAFFKGDERSRTLQAIINGEVIGEFDSNPATPFTALGIQGVGVETVTFTTVSLTENDWISLLEVRFMVEP